jgi:molybdenum cofactor cytidylyltransferase
MISCILLSAGESRRFQSPKALAEINGQTLIELTQKKLLETKLEEIIVVLGANNELIKPHILKNKRLKCVLNTNYQLGQTSSFKTGLKATDPKTHGFLLLPIDLPLVKPETIDTVIDCFLKQAPLILVPTFQNKKGHPPLFSMDLRDELTRLNDDQPLSEILQRHEKEILKIPVEDEGIVLSFNTPAEFEKILQKVS